MAESMTARIARVFGGTWRYNGHRWVEVGESWYRDGDRCVVQIRVGRYGHPVIYMMHTRGEESRDVTADLLPPLGGKKG